MIGSELSFYPVEMAAALRRNWEAGGHPAEGIPDDFVLPMLLDQMYQASLLAGRRGNRQMPSHRRVLRNRLRNKFARIRPTSSCCLSHKFAR